MANSTVSTTPAPVYLFFFCLSSIMFPRFTWFIFATFSGAHLETVSIFCDMDVRGLSERH